MRNPRIRKRLSELKQGPGIRSGFGSHGKRKRSAPAPPTPGLAESSLRCPVVHDTEPSWWHDCDRNDIA